MAATDVDGIQSECKQKMESSVQHLEDELKGVRTGRASPALVEYVKVDYYGAPTELRQLANITVPEATQLLIKPFDTSATESIAKAIQQAGLGLNPTAEGKQIRVSLPPLSTERRHELADSVKQMGEQAKVAIRNVRRDANKHIDQLKKDSSITEDDAKEAKDHIQNLLKKYEQTIDDKLEQKRKDIMET